MKTIMLAVLTMASIALATSARACGPAYATGYAAYAAPVPSYYTTVATPVFGYTPPVVYHYPVVYSGARYWHGYYPAYHAPVVHGFVGGGYHSGGFHGGGHFGGFHGR